MALAFYTQANKLLVSDFSGYMKDALAWNDQAAVGPENDVSTHATKRNNEGDITEMLKSGASRFAMSTTVYHNVTTGVKLSMAQAIASTDETVVVLKGIHQNSKPHVTVGFGPNIFHLHVQALGSDQTKFGVTGMSAGEAYEQLGWKTA